MKMIMMSSQNNLQKSVNRWQLIGLQLIAGCRCGLLLDCRNISNIRSRSCGLVSVNNYIANDYEIIGVAGGNCDGVRSRSIRHSQLIPVAVSLNLVGTSRISLSRNYVQLGDRSPSPSSTPTRSAKRPRQRPATFLLLPLGQRLRTSASKPAKAFSPSLKAKLYSAAT